MYIWDLNLRLFHWFLVLFMILSIISGKMNYLFFHQFFGSICLGLICFRIYWGFFGTYHSIFKNIFYTPKEIILFLKGNYLNKKLKTAHNPLGSLSVISFYFLIIVLCLSGLFSSDDILFDGPLAFISPKNTPFFTKTHNFFHYLIYALILLHILAVLYYQFIKKESLINQMIDGRSRSLSIKKENYDLKKNLFGFIILIMFMIIPVLALLFSMN